VRFDENPTVRQIATAIWTAAGAPAGGQNASCNRVLSLSLHRPPQYPLKLTFAMVALNGKCRHRADVQKPAESGKKATQSHPQIWNIKGCLVLKAILDLRAKSDRSNLTRCSTSPRLGIHFEAHGNEVSFEETKKAYP
jgi:hypothetical protein